MTVASEMNLFRDQQVAIDFQKMAKDGYVDVTFDMYGTTYFENGERHYIVSGNENKIIDFIKAAAQKHLCVMPLQSITETCQVPMGEKENIAYNVKVHLAQKMQEYYPLEFIQRLQGFYDIEGKDWAYPNLETMRKKVANTFSRDKLLAFKALVIQAYQNKTLTTSTYQKFMIWLSKEEENLQDDLIPKDILSKTWYTVMYLDASGKLKQIVNASKEWAYHKKEKLEREGKVVAPIYCKTYWYNNQMNAVDTRSIHVAQCKELFGEEYTAAICMIAEAPKAFEIEEFSAFFSECEEKYGDAASEALRDYGLRWRIIST